ncbi:hypothetical protein MKZ38_001924 [Zalerion maritima]|uniref:Uncharacterized protein n=1 Tax=Zalerion maritima TaxID=339359 RepID=A0AAD5RPP0_9PEZI|nr:hypothetical protein MKZ38_001924 [Zalerion maritima]
MTARDEFSVPTTPAHRTRSIPDAPPCTSHMCHGHSKTGSTSTTGSSITSAQTYPRLPRRSSSLCRRRDATLATLSERQSQPFPPASCDQRWTPPSSTASPRRLSRQSLAGTISSTASKMHSVQPLDTPPPSEGEDDCQPTPMAVQKMALKVPASQPTPEPSPELFPLPNKTIKGMAATKFLEASNYSKFVDPVAAGRKATKIPLRKSASTSSLDPARQTRLSQILDEPTFGDFMALSDDDIAESRPDTPLLPEAEADTSSSRRASDGSFCNDTGRYPHGKANNGGQEKHGGWENMEEKRRETRERKELLGCAGGNSPLGAPVLRRTATVSRKDQHASKPAAAAAFEAARIASRYGFELVYVVSLWPKDAPAWFPPSSPSSSCSSSRNSTISHSDAIITHSSGLSGRLMAAFGLGASKSPFKISTAVHQKILRNESWIEYRNSEALPDEFARGYACSFYATSSNEPRRSSEPSSATSHECQNDRGIVFAAYRRPRGSLNVSIGCEGQELESLHTDAKKLVDMLLAAQAPVPASKSPATYSPFPPVDRASRVQMAPRRPSTAKTAASCRAPLSPTLEATSC